MISFDAKICHNLVEASRREWLETNAIGGFASSTITGLNTRRYHALLVAATSPPVGRMVLLSKLEETLVVDGERFELSVNRYPGVFHPAGYRYLSSFRLDPFPVFTYEVQGVVIEKSVFMPRGENTVVVQYAVVRAQEGPAGRASGAVSSAAERASLLLELRPLIAFRDYHGTAHENGAIDSAVTITTGLVSMTPYAGLPTLYLAHDATGIERAGEWYRNFEYDIERERGLDYREDLFNPLVLTFDLARVVELCGSKATVIASTELHDSCDALLLEHDERERRLQITSPLASGDDFTRQLTTAADQFIVARGKEKTIIAGYHWFGDWGRDTMISLPGLTLSTGRPEDARSIVLEFSRHVDRGMLPNRFPDAGETPEYNTVDATLWYFEAVRQYVEHTGDREFVTRELYPVLADIMRWHFHGTRHGIHAEADGLLASGAPGVQLTWMDAKIGDWVVTPRHGKPVEIQALWHNALMFMAEAAQWNGDAATSERYALLGTLARASFVQQFWNEKDECLYDVVNGNVRDASIRPNQILAVSLSYPMLPPEKARAVVELVERELLTPYGLRTLARSDPQYKPSYSGDPFSRDSCYHQGTVWPWLIGPFISAYLKVQGRTADAATQAAQWLAPLEAHLSDIGLGQISEVFSGDPPHAPAGCIAQAWSVAEVLRVRQEILAIQAASVERAQPASAVIRSGREVGTGA